jgi:hypothetical protein
MHIKGPPILKSVDLIWISEMFMCGEKSVPDRMVID